MNQLAPCGPVYQAGTLSANPIAMTAGLVTLKKLVDGQIYAKLEALGRLLDEQVGNIGNLSVQREGSIFWLVPADKKVEDQVRTKADIPIDIGEDYTVIFQQLLNAGIYLPPSPFEVGFLSAVHSENDIRQLAEALSAIA